MGNRLVMMALMSTSTDNEALSAPSRDAIRTKGLLLEAGIELFAAQGPDGTSIDDICQRSGVNRRMIYHYYGNKRGLYLAVLQDVYNRIEQTAFDAESEARTLEEFVEKLTDRYFRFLQSNPEFVAMLRWENAKQADGLKEVDLGDFRTAVVRPMRDALVRYRGCEGPNDEEDALDILFTVLSLSGYYFSNQSSLAQVFMRDMTSEARMDQWLAHIKRVALTSLTEMKGS